MWIFYHDMTRAGISASNTDLMNAVVCLIAAGVIWFGFTRWVSHENR